MNKSIIWLFILIAFVSCKKKDTTTDVTLYINVNPASSVIIVNGTQQLVATLSPGNAPDKTVIWSSSDVSVATVSTSGLVTGISVGVATITAMPQAGNEIATCSITVKGSTTAVKAIDFLNSIGVCTHISQGADNPSNVATSLTYGGIRNIRDDGSKNTATLQKFIDVHNTSGAKVCLLPINGNIAASISEYEQLAAAGALLAAEGPNEPNNWHVTYLSQTSSSTTSLPIAWFCRDLYSAVKADPKLAGIPVFASSEAGGSEPDNCGLQFLTIPSGAVTLMPDGTIYADYANTHNYVVKNGQTSIVDNNAWNAEDPTQKLGWDGLYVEYGHTWSAGFDGYSTSQLLTLPRVTTETGWITVGTNSITEDQQGKLFLNLYLAAYKRGWSYTFIYMLRDDAVQGYWGLYHIDYTSKLSATYLHNLTTILADNTSVTPGSLNYFIPSEPVTTHDLLLQKSNGKFELVVWSERAIGSDNVSVNFGSTLAMVKVYDPTAGILATQTLNNVNSVTLTVSDHPVIIEIDK